MQRGAPADPVLGGHRRRAELLGDVDGRLAVGHREVHRLAHQLGEGLAGGLAEPGEVHPARRRGGEPDDAEAQRVLAPLAELFEQAPALQGGHQPRRRGLVDPQLLGDLGDAGLATRSEDLQDGDGPVHRLDRGTVTVRFRHGRKCIDRERSPCHLLWCGDLTGSGNGPARCCASRPTFPSAQRFSPPERPMLVPVRALADLDTGDAVRLEPRFTPDPAGPGVAVFRTEEGLHALDDSCTHQDRRALRRLPRGLLRRVPAARRPVRPAYGPARRGPGAPPGAHPPRRRDRRDDPRGVRRGG